MLQYYISQCGQNVNLDPTEVFLDHHLAVVLNKDYREQFLVNKSEDNWVQSHEYDIPITQKLSDSEDLGGIDYEVLTDMCEGILFRQCNICFKFCVSKAPVFFSHLEDKKT